MKKIEKYYESTADANPNYIVKKFIELKIEPGNAVELGCGAGVKGNKDVSCNGKIRKIIVILLKAQQPRAFRADRNKGGVSSCVFSW